jgi:hypothetical protein
MLFSPRTFRELMTPRQKFLLGESMHDRRQAVLPFVRFNPQGHPRSDRERGRYHQSRAGQRDRHGPVRIEANTERPGFLGRRSDTQRVLRNGTVQQVRDVSSAMLMRWPKTAVLSSPPSKSGECSARKYRGDG